MYAFIIGYGGGLEPLSSRQYFLCRIKDYNTIHTSTEVEKWECIIRVARFFFFFFLGGGLVSATRTFVSSEFKCCFF